MTYSMALITQPQGQAKDEVDRADHLVVRTILMTGRRIAQL